MGNLSRHQASPAGKLADLRFTEAAVSSNQRYPSGASFIGIGEPHFGDVLAEAVANAQPVVLVHSDGREWIGKPCDGGLAFAEEPPAPVRLFLVEAKQDQGATMHLYRLAGQAAKR